MKWIFLALLLLTDPVGDDHGAGLGYPCADVYQEVGFADITGFELKRVNGYWRVGVSLSRYPNPADAPLGFSLTTLAIYLDTGPGGSKELPGAGLKTPAGGGWDEAYLVSGWGAERRTADGDRQPARAWREGEWIWVQTDLREKPRVYVASGIYDPFDPWAFRAALPGGGVWYLDGPENAPRALDVVAADQERVWDTGVLPPARKQRSWKPVLSLILALIGAWFLFRAWRGR
jgi:hypothetical protein